MKRNQEKNPATIAARANGYFDEASGGVTPPLQPSTTFIRNENYELHNTSNTYGRDNNDQVRLAENILCQFECGEDTLLFSSGMAAISALINTLANGDRLLLQEGIYWGTTHWVRIYCEKHGIELIEADASKTESFTAKITEIRPQLVFVETPSNPWLKTADVTGIAKACDNTDTLLAVDATAASPILMKPLELGADISVHSATKVINGHSDVLAGVLTTADKKSEMWNEIASIRHGAGAILSAHSAWMLIRGMRTLPLRVERMCKNAKAIAEFLNGHSKVEAVWYPGLSSDSGNEIATKQMVGGYGYLISFLVKENKADALEFCRHLEGIHRATSLGGTESLVEHRHTVEGDMTGVPENLIRLSVGIEDAADLIAELDEALAKI